ncbi:MAG TPA: family 65 glycosyl hydrolase domain-containing protein [Paludibacteraceae bacterium]|nr:family 65 glycosyl hydrolase domain-containing protein [Paludibacteraceae bacterium]
MNRYLQHDPWCIIEEGFHPEKQLASESIFSLSNGHMGQRANFEEYYSGETMLGSYVAGIYYPEKAERGSWKNGYSEFNDKIVNAPNWTVISVRLNDERLDIGEWDLANFKRVLNMREGYLERTFEATSFKGHRIQVTVKRFLSMAENEIGVISYTVKSLNYDGRISFLPLIDGDVRNYYTNYNEPFWNVLQTRTEQDVSHLWAQTRKLDFHVCCALTYDFYKNRELLNVNPIKIEKEKVAGFSVGTDIKKGETVTLRKYVSVISSLNHPREELTERACSLARQAKNKGWDELFEEHKSVWAEKWRQSDVIIDNDVAAQQAIRFNIFQLNQTYSGNDPRLNISPKGFTGEKFSGATRWDTEAVCVPFYLSTSPQNVARNLLLYRFRHLPKAIQNAEKLGFTNGAALFPAATFNGSEILNEWELSFEEVYRNGIIAYAIYNYVRYTNDLDYLVNYGLKVLIAISRFWSQRVNISGQRKKYVILGVTGPNMYENNVNNNWFTNFIAVWCLNYTMECIETIRKTNFRAFEDVAQSIGFSNEETFLWKDIVENMYFPEDKDLDIFLQQDGFMDKTLTRANEIPESQRPINQHWTWDRILRSSLIKQADVVLGLYLFENFFDKETISKNFDFYEPLTVHESSLSPCIHSIVACKIGKIEKGYELYLRTARLDLDDYNNEVAEGLHITSMAGTWLSIVQGFGGMRIKEGLLHFYPQIPKQWQSFAFNVIFRGVHLNVRIEKSKVIIQHIKGEAIKLMIYDKSFMLLPDSLIETPFE